MEKHCKKYKDPFRSEYSSLFGTEPNRLGVEVVYLKSGPRSQKPMISVCIPHKVGSHAFGVFSRLSEIIVDQSQLDLPWNIKAELSLRDQSKTTTFLPRCHVIFEFDCLFISRVHIMKKSFQQNIQRLHLCMYIKSLSKKEVIHIILRSFFE